MLQRVGGAEEAHGRGRLGAHGRVGVIQLILQGDEPTFVGRAPHCKNGANLQLLIPIFIGALNKLIDPRMTRTRKRFERRAPNGQGQIRAAKLFEQGGHNRFGRMGWQLLPLGHEDVMAKRGGRLCPHHVILILLHKLDDGLDEGAVAGIPEGIECGKAHGRQRIFQKYVAQGAEIYLVVFFGNVGQMAHDNRPSFGREGGPALAELSHILVGHIRQAVKTGDGDGGFFGREQLIK